MRTYSQVHWDLRTNLGPATQHLCACGDQAKDWAYQHNGNPEVYDSESGRPYSEDWSCYTPMCRSCHFRMDVTEVQRLLGSLLGRGNALKAAQDPEFAAQVSRDRARAARKVNQKRRRCLDCGLTAHPAAVGAHLKGSRHSGYEELTE